MIISQILLATSFLFLTLSPEMAHPKIVDFNSDNLLFHPFVQKIKNYRSEDYLIKLLKRNLEQKLKSNRKRYDDNKLETEISDRDNQKFEKNKCACNCKCRSRNFGKRCGHCETTNEDYQDQEQAEPEFKNFICESKGSFANPQDCRQFYVCFHREEEPIEVTCPKGFAFDSEERKCTRKAARHCFKKHIYKN